MNKHTKTVGVVLAGVTTSASLGAVAGYFLAKKRLMKHYDELLEKVVEVEREETSRVDDHWRMILGQPPYDTPEAQTKRYLQELDKLDHQVRQSQQMSMDLGYSSIEEPSEMSLDDTPLYKELNTPKMETVVKIPKEATEILTEDEIKPLLLEEHAPETGPNSIVNEPDKIVRIDNIFDENTPEKKIEAVPDEFDQPQIARRPDVPYLISVDEFMDPNDHYEKITLTYYSGDKTLADDADRPVEDVERTVGNKNLLLLGATGPDGELSEIHVRNERITADFEVILDLQGYAEAIHGIQPRRSDDG